MWSYYGSKSIIINSYPPPKYGQIIEPFAGSARYALKYWDRDVILIDKYHVITDIWKWLQKCSKKDILSLPSNLKVGDHLDKFTFDCIEARWLVGFIINKGTIMPKHTVTARAAKQNNINYSIAKIANNIHKIKHWSIINGDYNDIDNHESTWFIDPPYQFGGHCYKESNKNIDFIKLGEWCKTRQGQVIVCEAGKADWMPFLNMINQYTTSGMQNELIWTNMPTSYGVLNGSLF